MGIKLDLFGDVVLAGQYHANDLVGWDSEVVFAMAADHHVHGVDTISNDHGNGWAGDIGTEHTAFEDNMALGVGHYGESDSYHEEDGVE